LMVIVDSRRGIGDFDRQMLGWGGRESCHHSHQNCKKLSLPDL
jgi:hypothetical protein